MNISNLNGFIKRGGVFFLLSSVFSKLSSLVLTVILAKYLSVSQFGLISQYLALSALIIPIISLSSQETYLYFASKKSLLLSEKIKLLVSFIHFNVICYLVFLIILIILGESLDVFDSGFYYFYIYSCFFSVSGLLLCYFRVVGLNRTYAKEFVTQNFFILAFVVFFVLFIDDSIELAWPTSLFVFIIFSFYLHYSYRFKSSFKSGRLVFPSSKYLKYGAAITLGVFSSLAIFHIDVLVVGYFVGDEAAGYYKLMTLLAIVILFIPTSYLASDFRHLVTISNEFSKIADYYRQYLKIFIPISIVLAICVYFFTPYIVLILAGDLPVYSQSVIICFSLSVVINFLVRAPVGNIFNSMGLVSLNVKISCIVLVFNLCSAVLATKYFGVTGAALSTLASFTFGAFISVFYFVKLKNRNNLLKQNLRK